MMHHSKMIKESFFDSLLLSLPFSELLSEEGVKTLRRVFKHRQLNTCVSDVLSSETSSALTTSRVDDLDGAQCQVRHQRSDAGVIQLHPADEDWINGIYNVISRCQIIPTIVKEYGWRMNGTLAVRGGKLLGYFPRRCTYNNLAEYAQLVELSKYLLVTEGMDQTIVNLKGVDPDLYPSIILMDNRGNIKDLIM